MIEHMEEQRPKLSEEDIARAEQRLGMTFPAPYRRFLMRYNGGRPVPDVFPCGTDESVLQFFYSIDEDDPLNLFEQVDLVHSHGRISTNYLPVADDPFGNVICLMLEGPDAGRVYFWDHEAFEDEDPMTELASDFDAFLATFFDDSVPPDRHLHKRGIEQMLDSGPALSDETITRTEWRLKVRFPEPYRGFLKRHNGGRPVPAGFVDGSEGRSRLFSQYEDHGIMTPADGESLSRIPPTVIPMIHAGSGDFICLGLYAPHEDKVYRWHHDVPDDEALVEIAPDFDTFVAQQGDGEDVQSIPGTSTLRRFYSIDENPGNLVAKVEHMRTSERIPRNYLPIANDCLSNQICLVTRGPDTGKVLFWNYRAPDDDKFTELAPDLDAFLAAFFK